MLILCLAEDYKVLKIMSQPKIVKYKKSSVMGVGKVPVNATGEVLLYVKHPVTTKLLVDFNPYGKAIVPLSSLEVIEEYHE